jgi:hypothetical protein
MEVSVHVCLTDPAPGCTRILTQRPDGVDFQAPAPLTEAGFPVNQAFFPLDRVSLSEPPSTLYNLYLKDVASKFAQRQNTVIFTYGAKATPKRPFMYGLDGIVAQVLRGIMSAPVAGSTYVVQCYALGVTENVKDMLDLKNDQGVVTDSVKEGPKVRQVERMQLRSAGDVTAMLEKITANYTSHFQRVLKEEDKGDAAAMPAYLPDSMILTFACFDTREAYDANVETNSIQFVVLGDSERPALCGIDVEQLNLYEKTHKTLAAVVGVLGAIRCNRLRIPYGKSKLTSLLKRTYNAEKNNTNNELNKPTASFMFIHAFTDDAHAEETYHTLTMGRRIVSVIGGGVGPVSRDLAVEKWRLEQDISELKDELTIARQVHDYKPCIYDQPKPVNNIQEEEQKKISAIQKRREEAREKAIADMKQKAQEEARQIIQEEEKQCARNLKDLEKRLAEKRAVNIELQAERGRKAKEFEKHLEKIRKKKEEEEQKAQKLREEIKALEEDLTARQANISKQKKQLDVLNQDQTKGREMILREREEIREKRTQLNVERRAQREQWLKEIDEINKKVLEQVKQLAVERASRASRDGVAPPEDTDDSEKTIREDIEQIDRYLPKLIQLDDIPEDNENAEKIRRQLEDYFNQERTTFQTKLEEERTRREQLERAAENYRSRINEQQNKAKKDQLTDAMKKEKHLESLTMQVVQYLEHGCRMTKIPSKGGPTRKRFFFLSEDRKKINICEMDEVGVPLNRKKPSNSIALKDIKRVLLGQVSATFKNFEKEGNKKGAKSVTPESLMEDTEGAYSSVPTQNITSENVTKYIYRSFTLEFRKAKTLDLVTETDSDFEAWMVALPRLFKDPSMEGPVVIEWGVPLDVTGRAGFEKLTVDEVSLCQMHHVTPMQYLTAKRESQQKSQATYVTVYDVRTMSSLDLLRSAKVHEFLVSKNIIPAASGTSS